MEARSANELNDQAEAFYLYQMRQMKDKEESKLFSLWWTETGRDQYIATCAAVAELNKKLDGYARKK